MATKSKFHSLSARRSSPRTRSGAIPEPISSPHTCSQFLPKPNSSPKTSEIPRTLFSLGAITPLAGTLKSVSLTDWWLKKTVNEKALCVSGYESKGGSEIKLFSSGTISERLDSVTLKTSDGITVSISGFINQARTLQNGFSLEVCNRFLLGFPYNWKAYNEDMNIPTDFSLSFDDIPVNRIHDFLVTASPSFKSKILDDVVDGLRDFVCPETQKLNKKSGKSYKKRKKSSLVSRDVGVKTRSMLEREKTMKLQFGKESIEKSK